MAEFAPEAKYEMRKLSDLTGWVDNPRTATRDAIERLKKQIDYLGLYKPLLINQDNIVLGGNMRLEVLRKLKGEQYEVMCSVVVTDNIAQMMDYALSDNDAVGVTDVDKVTEFATLNPVRSELFSIQSHPGTIVSELVKAAGPDSEEDEAPEVSSEPPVSKLGEIYQLGKWVYCPTCKVKHRLN